MNGGHRMPGLLSVDVAELLFLSFWKPGSEGAVPVNVHGVIELQIRLSFNKSTKNSEKRKIPVDFPRWFAGNG